jgi:hypothetical protein
VSGLTQKRLRDRGSEGVIRIRPSVLYSPTSYSAAYAGSLHQAI